jgi:hypothetical protein
VPEHPLPEGTLVRVTTKSVSGDPDLDTGASDTGRDYVVCDYAPAGSPSNDDPQGRAYYLLDIPDQTYGGDSWAYPEHIEVVQTVAQLDARKPPTLTAARDAVASSVASMMDVLDVSAVDYEGDAAMEVYGTTRDGLRVSFRLTVSDIGKSDY